MWEDWRAFSALHLTPIKPIRTRSFAPITLPARATAGMETAAAPVRAALVKSRLLQVLDMIRASRGISQSRAINVRPSSNTIVNHWLSVQPRLPARLDPGAPGLTAEPGSASCGKSEVLFGRCFPSRPALSTNFAEAPLATLENKEGCSQESGPRSGKR